MASSRGVEMVFHLSLSVPLDVKPKDKALVKALQGDMKRALKNCPALSTPLKVPLGPILAAVTTRSGSHTFLVMMVPVDSAEASRIAQVISSLDEVLDRYGLEMYTSRYGSKKQFHVSVGWCKTDRAEELNLILEDIRCSPRIPLLLCSELLLEAGVGGLMHFAAWEQTAARAVDVEQPRINVLVRSRSDAWVHINIPVGQPSVKESAELKSAASHAREKKIQEYIQRKYVYKKVSALQGDLMAALKHCPALSSPLSIPFGPRLAALATGKDGTGKYTFLVMMVPEDSKAATRITQVISCLDKVLGRYDLETYTSRYGSEKKYHLSVGWCLLNRADELNRELADTCCTRVKCPVKEIRMEISSPSRDPRKRENRLLWTPQKQDVVSGDPHGTSAHRPLVQEIRMELAFTGHWSRRSAWN
eukprot:gene18003-24412_t